MNQIEHIKVREGLVLNKMAVGKATVTMKSVTVKAPIEGACHVILIRDSSGSMYPHDRDTKKDAQDKAKASRPGDRWSIADFSSPGDFEWYMKGAPADTAKDKEVLCSIIERMRIRASTCFAEVLESLDKVLHDLEPLGLPVAMVLLTDGYPTDGWPLSRTLAALDKVANRIDSKLFVGYGSYYNKAILSQMAERAGGSLCHSSNIQEFSQSFTTVVEQVREVCTRVKVDLPSGFADDDLGGLFTVRNKTVTLLSRDKDNRVEVPVPNRGEGYVYGFSADVLPGSVASTYDHTDSGDLMLKGLYAGALVQAQKQKADLAQETLSAVGDPALVDEVANAYTPDDQGRAEYKIARAVERGDGRFRRGRKVGCAPDRNAFCMMDALDLFGADPDARFRPYEPGFKYKKIGPDSVPRAGNPEFHAAPNPSSELDAFVPHKTRLNLSALVRIPGTITLDEDAKQYGFDREYPTYIFRAYTLIESGNANCPQVPMEMSKATFGVLAKHGVVSGTWEKGAAVIVDFTGIPVMNRAMADHIDSAKPVCELKAKELELQTEQKVLKHYVDELSGGEGVREKSLLTAEQIAYLEKFYITSNGFSPPVDKAEPTDEYQAKAFYVDVAGFSSLPKVDEVKIRMDQIIVGKDAKGKPAKPLTPSMAMMSKTIEKVQAQIVKRDADVTREVKSTLTKLAKSPAEVQDAAVEKIKADATASLLRWINGQIVDNKAGLKSLRSETQRIKMAVILSGKWFSEFTSRENCVIEHKGLKFTFTLETETIKI